MSKKSNIEDLGRLEKEQAEKLNSQNNENDENTNVIEFSSNDTKPNVLDGYLVLEKEIMPHKGKFYPESWAFAYRCPTTKEVANFSTINEQDQPAIIAAVEDLIRKCVVIYDTEKERQVTAGQINDADRVFFLLKLRDFYLPGNPLTYTSVCSLCKEPLPITLCAEHLVYNDISEKLVEAFDGRIFTLNFPTLEEPIKFLIPTIEITGRIFKYIVKVYRDSQNDREKAEDKIVYDKQFLLIAPYLYIRGNESVKELAQKYRDIQKNENKFKAYLEIATKMKLDNTDYLTIECGNCESMEEAQLRFPGGWKSMFVSNKSNSGYFN